MKVVTKYGIDKLLFGMKQKDVELIYGKPNKQFKDEEKNIIYLFNDLKLQLTFYQDEDFKLGYIISSNKNLEIYEISIIGKNIDLVKKKLQEKNIKAWQIDDYDATENHFNELNWLVLQTEFNEIIRVEIGAIINNKDEFDWKF